MGEKEKLELDSNENAMSYSSTSMALDWRFEGANLANSSVGLVTRGDLIGSSPCSSAPMVDSYGPNFLDHPPSSGNLGFCDNNVQSNSNTDGTRKAGQDDRTKGMGWNPVSCMMKRNDFLPNGPGIFPQGLSQFATDSGFIECAARFSCFSAGNFGDMVNSYGIPQSMALRARNGGSMLGEGNALLGHGLESAHGGQSHDCGPNVVESTRDVSRSVEHLGIDGSPIQNDKRSDCPVLSTDEGKQALGESCNEADRAESSDDDGVGSNDDSQMMDCRNGDPSIKGLNQKKRTRSGKDADDSNKATGTLEVPKEAARDNCENGQKGDQRPTSTTKAPGKDAKQVFQPSDLPKEGYIHVRARRGQATNSHSLAERVRREKISERMKFLQDLVPGCNKVTGKAVMLDEIINYVQSLQRQVEFLSMKLATVNPHMGFNIEGLLAKDIHQHRPGSSSALGFLREMSMAFPPFYPFQTGLIHSTLPKMANSPDILGQTIQPQLAPLIGEFKEPNLAIPLEAAMD